MVSAPGAALQIKPGGLRKGSGSDVLKLRRTGIDRIAHPVTALDLAPLLDAALAEEFSP